MKTEDLEERIQSAHAFMRPRFTYARNNPYNGLQVDLTRHSFLTTALLEPDRPTRICLTYDFGTHASGWWRNSDYDRCWHVSISHPQENRLAISRIGTPEGLLEIQSPHPLHGKQFVGQVVEPPSDEETRAWARAAFPHHYRWCWIEPPASRLDPYRLPGVSHVRLFLNQQDQPIKPEGEVYRLKPYPDGSSPEKIFR